MLVFLFRGVRFYGVLCIGGDGFWRAGGGLQKVLFFAVEKQRAGMAIDKLSRVLK